MDNTRRPASAATWRRELRGRAGRRVHGRPRAARARCSPSGEQGQAAATSTAILKEQFPNLALTRIGRRRCRRLHARADAARRAGGCASGVVEQALQIIRNRIDQFGVAEPTVKAQGADRDRRPAPGHPGPAAREGPDRPHGAAGVQAGRAGAAGRDAAEPGAGHRRSCRDGRRGGPRRSTSSSKRPIMTGDVLTDAQVRPGSALEGYAVDFVLDARGATLFGDATTRERRAQPGDRPRRLRPVGAGDPGADHRRARPDHRPLRPRGGAGPGQRAAQRRAAGAAARCSRSGRSARRWARTRSARERSRSSSAAWRSSCSCCVYYRGGGVIADVALLVNVLLLLGAFAVFGFTLTLPGIAGIVLTVGMAVDANVLILERMREELRARQERRARRSRRATSGPGPRSSTPTSPRSCRA